MMTEMGNEFWTAPEYFRQLPSLPEYPMAPDLSYTPELMGSYPMSTIEEHGMYTMPDYFKNLYQ